MCAKNYGNWLAVDKVIAKIIWLTFFWPTLYFSRTRLSFFSSINRPQIAVLSLLSF